MKESKRSTGTLNFPARRVIPRRVVFVFLASFYSLAFIITPYWKLGNTNTVALVVLALTISLGTLWSLVSASDVHIALETRSWILFGCFLILFVALNHEALTSVIPWRGDEDHHIIITETLAGRISAKFVSLAFLVFCLIVYSVQRKSYWITAGSLALALYMGFAFFEADLLQGLKLIRYPFVSYWFFAAIPKIAWRFTGYHVEILYRIFPLLSAVLLAWSFQRQVDHPNPFARLLWALSVATMPVVFYYSSILYLELPAVVLMTIVCLNAKELLHDDFSDMEKKPAWLALILIGFIKETTIVFLLCFLLTRIILLVRRLITSHTEPSPRGIASSLAVELAVVFCTLYPSLLFLALRAANPTLRPFAPDISNLLDSSIYKVTAYSVFEQFGIFPLLFLGGLVLLLRRRAYVMALFSLLLVLSIPLFFGIDTKIYAGYSRFNLFLVPPVLAGSIVLINRADKWKMNTGAILATAVIAINLIISPINPDGTKQPFWGNYLIDTSEHYFPYDDALRWLKDNHNNDKILLPLLGYRYYFDFYFSKLGWMPEYEVWYTDFAVWTTAGEEEFAMVLSDILSRAGESGFDVVLFPLKGNIVPPLEDNTGYCLEKVFENQAHALILFSADNNCGQSCADAERSLLNSQVLSRRRVGCSAFYEVRVRPIEQPIPCVKIRDQPWFR